VLSGAERTLGRARSCRAGGGTRKPRCSGSAPRTRPGAGRSPTSARPTTWARCHRYHRTRTWWRDRIGSWIVREGLRENVWVFRAVSPEPHMGWYSRCLLDFPPIAWSHPDLTGRMCVVPGHGGVDGGEAEVPAAQHGIHVHVEPRHVAQLHGKPA
jgi:hypothetical protein